MIQIAGQFSSYILGSIVQFLSLSLVEKSTSSRVAKRDRASFKSRQDQSVRMIEQGWMMHHFFVNTRPHPPSTVHIDHFSSNSRFILTATEQSSANQNSDDDSSENQPKPSFTS